MGKAISRLSTVVSAAADYRVQIVLTSSGPRSPWFQTPE